MFRDESMGTLGIPGYQSTEAPGRSYLEAGGMDSSLNRLESKISENNLHQHDWQGLYEKAITAVMHDPSQETLESVCSELKVNCPAEYEQMLSPTLKMLEGYVNKEQEKSIDEMTGLYNQNMFYQTLDKVLSRAERHGEYFSVLAIDANKFKEINDNFGHQEGDRAIQYVADKVHKVTRQEDVAARYGGDEFAVILQNTDEEGAYRVAERLRQEMEKDPFKLQDGSQMYIPGNIGNISLSYGIAGSSPGERIGSNELYNRADKACYEAKNNPEKIATYGKPYKILPIEQPKAA